MAKIYLPWSVVSLTQIKKIQGTMAVFQASGGC
jgi:hypothetical protein